MRTRALIFALGVATGAILESHRRVIKGLWGVVEANDALSDLLMLYMSTKYQEDVDEAFDDIVERYEGDI